jgi:hypothetical protein
MRIAVALLAMIAIQYWMIWPDLPDESKPPFAKIISTIRR